MIVTTITTDDFVVNFYFWIVLIITNQIRAIFKSSKRRVLRNRQALFRQGDRGESMFFVCLGELVCRQFISRFGFGLCYYEHFEMLIALCSHFWLNLFVCSIDGVEVRHFCPGQVYILLASTNCRQSLRLIVSNVRIFDMTSIFAVFWWGIFIIVSDMGPISGMDVRIRG